MSAHKVRYLILCQPIGPTSHPARTAGEKKKRMLPVGTSWPNSEAQFPLLVGTARVDLISSSNRRDSWPITFYSKTTPQAFRTHSGFC